LFVGQNRQNVADRRLAAVLVVVGGIGRAATPLSHQG